MYFSELKKTHNWALLSYGNHQKPELNKKGDEERIKAASVHDQCAVSLFTAGDISACVHTMTPFSEASPNPAPWTQITYMFI